MLFSQQIVDSLNGVEGLKRNFNEDRTPVAHSTIPKTGKLKSLQFATILALVGDETSSGINKLGKVELIALIVTDSTYEVNGIEVSALCEHLHILLIVGIDLATLKDLQTDTTIRIVCS